MPARPVILIITSGPLCRNPRVLKEADALGRSGFDVTVLTLANLERFEAYDREIMKTAPFKKIAIDHLGMSWTSRGAAFGSRLATWVARHGVRFGLQSAQALGPAYSLGRMARGYRADLTIVHTELPLCLGLDLIEQGRRVATDFEDWHSQDLLPDAQTSRPIRLIRKVEGELMRRSVYTSTTSQAMADALQAAYGGATPVVITNSFPLQSNPAAGAREGPPAIFWFSQTIGAGRGLEQFIAAWRQTKVPSRLCLLGDVDPAYRQKLFDRLPPQQRQYLEFLPIVAPEELPAVIARHDLGLALEANLPANKDCTISNKILQYFNAGIGVLATGTSGQREALAQAPGAGEIIDLNETGELSRRLDTLLGDRTALARMGAAGRHAAETHYSWEKEAARLVATVESALRSVPNRPA